MGTWVETRGQAVSGSLVSTPCPERRAENTWGGRPARHRKGPPIRANRKAGLLIPSHKDRFKTALIDSIAAWIRSVEQIEALTSEPAARRELAHLRIGMVQAGISIDRLFDHI